MSKTPFPWESRPSGVSWVDKFNASQAMEQCKAWDIAPSGTLEANRVILKNYIKNRSQKESSNETTDTTPQLHSDSETSKQGNAETDEDKTEYFPPPGPNDAATTQHSAAPGGAITARTIPPHVGDWMTVIQATAAAVGENIAAALAVRQSDRETATNKQLPSAIYDMITALPNCSGADSHTLLKFLIGTNQIFELGLTDEKQTLIAILPKTTGQLRAVWVSAITKGISHPRLSASLIETFLPDRAKQQLILEAIYRVQKPNESLIDFITNVQNSAKVLLASEADLLDIILTGMNASTRACLAGFPAPRTVEELLRLIPRLEVIRNIERPSDRPQLNSDQEAFRYQQRGRWQHREAHANNTFSRNGAGRFHQPNNNYGPNQAVPAHARLPFRPNTYHYGPHRHSFSGNYQARDNQPAHPNHYQNKSNSGRGR